MAVPLTLKVFKGESLVTSKDFERDIIKIGRLSSAHLCLEDEKVSRIHSVIEVGADSQGCYLRTIGGNEGDTVGMREVRLSAGGLVRNPDGVYIALIETLL